MKITASKRTVEAGRREDIMRERDAWDANKDTLQKQYDDEYRQFTIAQHNVMAPIQQAIEQGLSKFDKLQVDVRVNIQWRGRRLGGDSIGVRIQVNENNKFADDSALSWDMEVGLDAEGNVVKETGSWSGLKATNAQQLESLRQTLGALEYLNSINWVDLLDRALPNWEDYVHTNVPDRRDRPNFEQELMEAELEDLVGADKAVKVENWESSGYRGKYVWVQLITESPAQYTGRVYGDVSDSAVREWMQRAKEHNYAPKRIRKATIKPVTPLKVIEL